MLNVQMCTYMHSESVHKVDCNNTLKKSTHAKSPVYSDYISDNQSNKCISYVNVYQCEADVWAFIGLVVNNGGLYLSLFPAGVEAVEESWVPMEGLDGVADPGVLRGMRGGCLAAKFIFFSWAARLKREREEGEGGGRGRKNFSATGERVGFLQGAIIAD